MSGPGSPRNDRDCRPEWRVTLVQLPADGSRTGPDSQRPGRRTEPRGNAHTWPHMQDCCADKFRRLGRGDAGSTSRLWRPNRTGGRASERARARPVVCPTSQSLSLALASRTGSFVSAAFIIGTTGGTSSKEAGHGQRTALRGVNGNPRVRITLF